jgi:ATP-binding cassette, subfamily B, multidrug efflux pump
LSESLLICVTLHRLFRRPAKVAVFCHPPNPSKNNKKKLFNRQKPKLLFSVKALAWLNKYFWKYRLRLFSGILFIGLSTWFSLVPANLVGKGIDFATWAIQHPEIPAETITSILLRFGLEVIGYTLAYGVFLFLNRQTIIVMSRLIEYDLKNEIFDHYQKLDQRFYKQNNTGDLMNRISEDVSRVRMYIGPAVMYTTSTAITLIMTIMFMFSSDVRLALYVLAPLPILTISIYYVSNRINRKSLKVQQQLSQLSTNAQETFSGVRVIKAFAREENTEQQFANAANEYMSRTLSLARTESMFQPFMLLLIGLSILLTVLIGGREVIDGKLSVGTIATFILFVIRLTWPIAALGWVTSLVQRAAASQERINEFLKTKPAIASATAEPFELRGDIEFRNVRFVYPDSGIKALDGISFTVKAGQSAAFLGRTGSGKSTLAQLMVRLYDVSEGEILVDGHDIRTVNLNDLREAAGYVPQEVFLFSETIAGNIAFSAHDLREIGTRRNEIEQAAKDAAIHSNILEFPQGYETLVGERGVTLSGGQQQRISIARAILKHPKLLIFDDCLSAVDTETEDEILGNLRRIMHGKTTIIISHRVSAVRNADQIFILDEGKIIEQGTHQELLNAGKHYADLYNKQVQELQR